MKKHTLGLLPELACLSVSTQKDRIKNKFKAEKKLLSIAGIRALIMQASDGFSFQLSLHNQGTFGAHTVLSGGIATAVNNVLSVLKTCTVMAMPFSAKLYVQPNIQSSNIFNTIN